MQRENLFTSYDVKHIIAMILAAHKQPKEAIHLLFLVKINDSQILPFQFLIFFRINGDPSVFFAEGEYIENGGIFHKISHRDPTWKITIGNVCTSLPKSDVKKGTMLAMITRIESTIIVARPGDLGEFMYRGGNLYPKE